MSHHYHSVLLATVGRIDDSLDAAIRAWEMEPDTQILNSRLAITYFWIGDMENARRFYRIANTMGPGGPLSQLSYALFLVRDGRIDEARETSAIYRRYPSLEKADELDNTELEFM